MRFASLARLLITTIAVTALTAACGGGADNAQTSSNGGLEKTDLTLGMLPLPEVAPIQIAISKGYFKEEGLNVKYTLIQGGGNAINTLRSGGFDIMHSNHISMFTAAASKAADLRIVAEADTAAPGNFAIVATPESKITKPEDLKGKTIGVNTLKNVATLTISAQLKAKGLDPERDVKFVELQFPLMWQAIKSGQVDAGFLPEPFLTGASTDGAVTVLDVIGGPTDNFPVAGYYVLSDFLQKHPKTIAAFQRGLLKAQKLAATDRKEVEKALPAYAKIDEKTASLMEVPNFPISMNEQRLQRVADLMLEFGYLKSPFDAKTLTQGVPEVQG
jgi:ABC-type nitrate/sulfonate/bicarbonate transport systems, periplasmic components